MKTKIMFISCSQIFTRKSYKVKILSTENLIRKEKKEKACPNPRSGYRGHCIMLLLLYSNTAWSGCSAFVFTRRKEMEKLK